MKLRLAPEGTMLAGDVRAARTPWGRMAGLMGRRAMPGDGLLIEPGDSIHTFFMRMAIDLLFLDTGGAVLRVCPSVPPWRIRLAPRGTARVLELPAGWSAARGVREGTRLELAGP